MRRVISSHDIDVDKAIKVFKCKRCKCIFESNEYITWKGGLESTDQCPLCETGIFVEEVKPDVKQNSA
jgi:DNA-directed RNA polymerase subunit RPC12/RpoP